MSTVEEIQRAVAQLKPEELARFRRWFLEREADAWDREIEEDVEAGRLDFLAEEALKKNLRQTPSSVSATSSATPRD